jgi:hypothetical protein
VRPAARAPVDEPDIDAGTAATDVDDPAPPVSDAQRGPGGRVVAARIGTGAHADARLAVPGRRSRGVVAGRACLGHWRRLGDGTRGVRLRRLRARRVRRLVHGEIGDRSGRRTRGNLDGVGRAVTRTELDRVEVCGGQCRRGRWGSSGCGGRDPQRRKRAEEDQRARSSAGQTMTPLTMDSSGRR